MSLNSPPGKTVVAVKAGASRWTKAWLEDMIVCLGGSGSVKLMEGTR